MGWRSPAGAAGVPRVNAAGGEATAQLAGVGRACRDRCDCCRLGGIRSVTDTLGRPSSCADDDRTDLYRGKPDTGPGRGGRT